MPYITQKERDAKYNLADTSITKEEIGMLMGINADNGGQLNYMFSVTIAEYIAKHGLKYDTIQDIMGMIEVAKAEFVSRVVIPYEKLKAIENGAGIYDSLEVEIAERIDIAEEIKKSGT